MATDASHASRPPGEPAPADLDRALDRLARQRQRVFADGSVLVAGSLRAFHRLPELHERVALHAIACHRLGLARSHLRHASAYHGHIWAMAALPPGESVAFRPPEDDDGALVGSGTTGPVESTTHRAWLDAFALAVMVGDHDTAARLVRVEAFHVPAPAETAPPALVAWVGLYRATMIQPADLAEVIDRAARAAVDAEPEEFRVELAHTAVPVFGVYAAVAASDQAAFERAVAEADEAHRRWYGVGDRSGDVQRLLDRHTAAMVALGRHRGLDAPPSPTRPDLLG